MKRLLVSCFGLGWLPLFPGTWGSLPPAVIFAVLGHFGLSTFTSSLLLAALALASSIICVKYSSAIIEATGQADPREVVADEFAGQSVTFLAAPFILTDTFSTRQVWTIAGLGFLFFRLFDIVKLWPINKLQKLPEGWGILADDLLAGIYAAIVLQICARFWVIRP